ncbi:MAG: two-component system response regulator [Gallionella sp.]|nr:two-component system response regulator [Gallionella sp.]MDD4947557.1 two-component system response regulator [Gallionella sp.]MDD5612026.1 two-component system response regulator [Gallionella sp.]
MSVIIVDDTPINITLLSHLVGKLEDSVAMGFTEPVKGLDWCVEQLPDLVIVDYMMPEMDGIEFVRRLRATPGREDIPVLMITANDQLTIRHQALEAGANDFLTKPIDKAEFMARSRNMLSLRRSQRKLADRAEWLAEEVRKATAEILARERETVIRLSKAADSRDPETGAHILRMSHYSKLIAANLGLSEADQELLLEAAPMHDIGKVGIPDNVLLKPGRLDHDEFEIMKRHAIMGYEILNGSSSVMLQAAAQIALGHHEKYDGSGYPYGVKGEDIPIFARICAVADVFDALTSERPYKKAWEDDRAIALLNEGKGSHFDPACVEAFLQNWEAILEIRNRFKEEDYENNRHNLGAY